MSQGNMLLGYARGSVGDVTFYRSGGSQRARARNRKPNNPRSSGQMTQRAKFASAVKFYKRAVSNFFRFAYQDKKTNESDYNAFMRHNIQGAPLISKTAFDKQGYPALGNWVLTYGELQPLNYLASENGSVIELPDNFSSNPSTLGELSQGLINSGFYEQGDIITVVMIDITGSPLPTATPSGVYTTAWTTAQFRVDYNSIESLNNLGLGTVTVIAQSGVRMLNFASHSAFAVIVSRNTSGGLKVSRSELVYDAQTGLALFNAYTDDNYKAEVLQDWNTSLEAILQGSLSEMSTPAPTPTRGTYMIVAYTTATGGSPTSYNKEISEGAVSIVHLTDHPYVYQSIKSISFATTEDADAFYALQGNVTCEAIIEDSGGETVVQTVNVTVARDSYKGVNFTAYFTEERVNASNTTLQQPLRLRYNGIVGDMAPSSITAYYS